MRSVQIQAPRTCGNPPEKGQHNQRFMRSGVHLSVILSRGRRTAYDIAPVPRSILGWFTLAWSAFLIVALAVGALLVSLYDQTTAAQIRRGEAAVENGCEAIAGRVSFLLTGTTTPPASGSAALDHGLRDAVVLALRGEHGVQGGVWSLGRGTLAEAYPTAARVGAETGLTVAERATVRTLAESAILDGAPSSQRLDAGRRVVLATACPLRVAVPHLAGWTLVRVETAGGSAFLRAAAGLGILLAVLLASAAWLGLKLRFWGVRLRRLETALAQGETLPALAPTGQRDLDRIVAALNGAGARLAAARARADALGREVARSERMAALGRIAAGVAHEVRNPIAAMRLKAENALAPGADPSRQERALRAILDQIARLDALAGDLLGSAWQVAPRPRPLPDLGRFLAERLDTLREQAQAREVALSLEVPERLAATLDADRIGRAIDNLVLNAVQNTPPGGRVLVAARRIAGGLQISVSDTGNGVPPALRPHLFEPFVTGRPDGTGLGLAIVRETVEAHGGRVRALHPEEGTTITIELPE